MYRQLFKVATVLLALCLISTHSNADTVITIDSDGWQLKGDLAVPESPVAFAILLHKAAGDRSAYNEMARILAEKSIASIRLDLRGHGESINLGSFDPTLSGYFNPDDERIVRNFDLIRAGDKDILSLMAWLERQKEFRDLPLVVIGSSYTGQEMVEAARESRFADVYVALAPGSFDAESIAAVDPSGVPWLFVRAEVELPFFPDLFDAIGEGAKSAEIWTLPGEGHATDLFEYNAGLERRLVDWINNKLHLEQVPQANKLAGFASVGTDRIYFESSGDGAPLVLVSGGSGMDLRQWHKVFPLLARSHRVIAYDPRGIGNSDNPTEEYSDSDDLVQLLDYLQLDKVTLGTGRMRVQISRNGLLAKLGIPTASLDDRNEFWVFEVPYKLRNRGRQLKILPEGIASANDSEPDPTLLKLLRRAHAWRQQLETGPPETISNLAAANGVNASYFTRVLRIAYLAPDIHEAIIEGRQPPELTANKLVRVKNLSIDWASQRQALGFPAT